METRFMVRALELAKLSVPLAKTNPPVGAVIVKNHQIIGEGFHRGPGFPHAEIEALNDVRKKGFSALGATLYVTLEPCCHEGQEKRTPPCTKALIDADFASIVVACLDPNPRVNGGGVGQLRHVGMEVITGVLEEEAQSLLRHFQVSIKRKRPFVTLKWAQSLDGRIACRTGFSRWISSEAARAQAHQLRAAHDAVLIGAGTALTDDPQLNVRHGGGAAPWKIVLWGTRPLNLGLKIFCRPEKTVLVCGKNSSAYEQASAHPFKTLALDVAEGSALPLPEVLSTLYREQVGSLLVEGGGQVLTQFLKEDLWDALTIFISPLILGTGIDAVGDLGTEVPDLGIGLKSGSLSSFDGGWRFDYERWERG